MARQLVILESENENPGGRLRRTTILEFKTLLAAKQIRGASLDDVMGTHHQRPLYKHPHTGELFVSVLL